MGQRDLGFGLVFVLVIYLWVFVLDSGFWGLCVFQISDWFGFVYFCFDVSSLFFIRVRGRFDNIRYYLLVYKVFRVFKVKFKLFGFCFFFLSCVYNYFVFFFSSQVFYRLSLFLFYKFCIGGWFFRLGQEVFFYISGGRFFFIFGVLVVGFDLYL